MFPNLIALLWIGHLHSVTLSALTADVLSFIVSVHPLCTSTCWSLSLIVRTVTLPTWNVNRVIYSGMASGCRTARKSVMLDDRLSDHCPHLTARNPVAQLNRTANRETKLGEATHFGFSSEIVIRYDILILLSALPKTR